MENRHGVAVKTHKVSGFRKMVDIFYKMMKNHFYILLSKSTS